MSCNCCHEEHGHDCCHTHEDANRKALIVRLCAGTLLFGIALFTKITWLYYAAYLILGYDVLINAVKDIKNIFNECFLMSIATIGAFAIGEYPEAAAVMLFYQIGELLSDYAVDKSKENIGNLMDLRSDTAHILRNGNVVSVPCQDVEIGETIRVLAGEKIPLDGTITAGNANLDTSALTGEAIPLSVSVGDSVMSGSINSNSVIDITVTKRYSESTATKILDLVKENKKSKTEKFITRFSRIYTPIVVISALLIGIIPSIITGDTARWIYTAMTFLVVSCPCALIVSVPLTFFAGLGRASRKGILVKGSESLENLSKIKSIAFDKTGTLTEGKFTITNISAAIDRQELLKYAAYTEYYSSHPIAKAIVAEYGGDINAEEIFDYKENAGYGVSAMVFGHYVSVGSAKHANADAAGKNAVYVSIDGAYAGSIELGDKIRREAKKALTDLSALKVTAVMLTGDCVSNAERVANILQIPYHAELLPADKVEKFKQLGNAAFVGDGINDAPVLSCANVGISMGGIGSDAAIESSDAVIMSDDLSKIPLAVKIARRTMKLLHENIIFALAIKIAVMLLGILGYASMWLAVFADVGVCLLVVLNALRAFIDKD